MTKEHDARAVIREYIKRFGETPKTDDESFAGKKTYLNTSGNLLTTLLILRRRYVLAVQVKRMLAAIT